MTQEHPDPAASIKSSAGSRMAPSSDLTETTIHLYRPECDVAHFPAFAAVAEVLQRAHASWWSAWVPSECAIPPATLCLQVRDFTHGYRWGDDTIFLFLDEYDIDDVLAEGERRESGLTAPGRQVRGLEWATVTGFLIHEMLHVYQAKVMLTPTPEGIALFETSKVRWSGPGHDARFYSAIAAIAPFFGLTAEAFAKEL